MPPESPPWSAKRWLQFAASDFLLARSRPNGSCSKCCEAIKAVLIAQGIEFPRTHNLRVLLELLSERLELPAPVWNAAGLTDFAVSSRYPGDLEAVTDQEYEEALELAEAVLRWAEEIVR